MNSQFRPIAQQLISPLKLIVYIPIPTAHSEVYTKHEVSETYYLEHERLSAKWIIFRKDMNRSENSLFDYKRQNLRELWTEYVSQVQ